MEKFNGTDFKETPGWCPVTAGIIALPVILPITAFAVAFCIVISPTFCGCFSNRGCVQRLGGGPVGHVFRVLREAADRVFQVYLRFIGLDMSLTETDAQKLAVMGMLEEDRHYREADEDELKRGPMLEDLDEGPMDLPPTPAEAHRLAGLVVLLAFGGAVARLCSVLADVCIIYGSLRIVEAPIVAHLGVMRGSLMPATPFLKILEVFDFTSLTQDLVVEYRCYSLKMALSFWAIVLFVRLFRGVWISEAPWRVLGDAVRRRRIRKGVPGRRWRVMVAEAGFSLGMTSTLYLVQFLWLFVPSVLWIIGDIGFCPDHERDVEGNCILGSFWDQRMFGLFVPFLFILIFGGLLPPLWRGFVGTGWTLPSADRTRCCPGGRNLQEASGGSCGQFFARSIIFVYVMAGSLVQFMNSVAGIWLPKQLNAHELDDKVTRVLRHARSQDEYDNSVNKEEEKFARRSAFRAVANTMFLVSVAIPGGALVSKVGEHLNQSLVTFRGSGVELGVDDSSVYSSPIRWVEWLLNVFRLTLIMVVVFLPKHGMLLLIYIAVKFVWDVFIGIKLIPKAPIPKVKPPRNPEPEVDI